MRESVVGLIYAYDLGNEEIVKFVEDILEEKKIRNKQKEFAYELFNGVIDNLEAIDALLKDYLEKKWDIQTLGAVEKAILRLGVYELLFSTLDAPIIINEAVELAKNLSSDSSPKFINGVLDAIKKDERLKRETKQSWSA